MRVAHVYGKPVAFSRKVRHVKLGILRVLQKKVIMSGSKKLRRKTPSALIQNHQGIGRLFHYIYCIIFCRIQGLLFIYDVTETPQKLLVVTCVRDMSVQGEGARGVTPSTLKNYAGSKHNIVRKFTQILLCRSIELHLPRSIRRFCCYNINRY